MRCIDKCISTLYGIFTLYEMSSLYVWDIPLCMGYQPCIHGISILGYTIYTLYGISIHLVYMGYSSLYGIFTFYGISILYGISTLYGKYPPCIWDIHIYGISILYEIYTLYGISTLYLPFFPLFCFDILILTTHFNNLFLTC